MELLCRFVHAAELLAVARHELGQEGFQVAVIPAAQGSEGDLVVARGRQPLLGHLQDGPGASLAVGTVGRPRLAEAAALNAAIVALN